MGRRIEALFIFFEKYVIDLLKATHNQTKTAELVGTSFDVVNRIMHSSVERGLNRREFQKGELVMLGIDEKSFKKGHEYVSILIDLKGQRIIDVAKGRTKEATEKLLTENLTQEQLSEIRAVSMDMWESYMLVVEKLLPNADIVHDKFHIIQYLKQAIDNERKKEVKTEAVLKKGKFTVLKKEKNLTEDQKIQFDKIMTANLKTAQAWSFAETFNLVYDSQQVAEAYAYFDMWVDAVKNSTISAMKKVAKTFEKHITGIINYVKHRITNAKTERFNGKIQSLKNISRGYKSFENFRSAILFFNGNLKLYSHKFL